MAEMRKRTSMSVLEMGRMLGLGKTESYWLIKKNYFKTILVGNTMRVMIDSFEEWYANQFKYQKVDGTSRRGIEENYIFNGGAWTAPWAERSDCLRTGCQRAF